MVDVCIALFLAIRLVGAVSNHFFLQRFTLFKLFAKPHSTERACEPRFWAVERIYYKKVLLPSLLARLYAVLVETFPFARLHSRVCYFFFSV